MLNPSAGAVLLWVLPLLVPAVADELGLRYGRVFLLLLPGLVLAALMAQGWRWQGSGLGRWYNRWLGPVRWGRVLGLILAGLVGLVLIAALAVSIYALSRGGFGALMGALPKAFVAMRKIVAGWTGASAAWIMAGAPILLPMLLLGAALGRLGRHEAPAAPIGRVAAIVALLVGLVVQLTHWLVAAVPAALFVLFAWTRAKPAEMAPAPLRLTPLLLASAGFAAAWLLPTLIDQKASSLFPMPLGIGVLTAIAYLAGGAVGARLDLKLGGALVLIGLAMLWWLGPFLALVGAILVAAGALALVLGAGGTPWLAPALAAFVIGAPQYWRSKVWHEYTPAWTALAVAALTLIAVTVVLLRSRQAR